MDALNVLDLATAIGAAATRFAYPRGMAQTGDQFAFEFAARMPIGGVADGLVGYRFLRGVGPKEAEFACNLLRRPEKIKQMRDHLKQGAVTVQFGDSPWYCLAHVALRGTLTLRCAS